MELLAEGADLKKAHPNSHQQKAFGTVVYMFLFYKMLLSVIVNVIDSLADVDH